MFGEILKELRAKTGVSQKKLSEGLHVSQQTVGSWEVNRTTPSPDVMRRIADYFNVSIDHLYGRDTTDNSNSTSRSTGVRIPVYGETAAGIPITAIENFDSDDPDDWEEIPEDMARSGEYIALRIKGDSMEPRMRTGDVVIVRLQPEVENGDIAIVRVNGDEATCKKIKKTPEGVMLISLNPAYEPMFFTKKQVQTLPLTILGRVVELRAKF